MSRDGEPSDIMTLQCRICGKPVPISAAITDADGKAVHDGCLCTLEINSADGDGVLKSRPWKQIAAEIAKEFDSKKMGELIMELNQALDDQNIDGQPKPSPHGQP